MDPPRPRARRVPGPAGAHLLAGLWRRARSSACRSTSWSRRGEYQRADRHRPRSPRHRIGGVAEPRNGRHARRQRRDRRLADPQCAAERGVRRNLGVGAPWRRRRHRLLAARGHGHRRRRHAPRRTSGSSACSPCDPGIGVARHADAGYPEALAAAAERGVRLPMSGRRSRPDVMTVARPAFERRVLSALEADPARIPVLVGGCGIGPDVSASTPARASRRRRLPVHRHRAIGDDARTPASAVVDASPFSAADVDVNVRSPRAGVRRLAGVLPGRAQPLGRAGRRSCSTKCSSSAPSRTSPACATCCAI